jgi:long-chain acyl-CoA synthetase
LLAVLRSFPFLGKPKGVVMTHANLVAAVAGLEIITRTLHFNEKDVRGDRQETDSEKEKRESYRDTQFLSFLPFQSYLAFLPLSHVLELVVELTLLHCGVALGYGRVRTLSDQNMRNSKGDLRELRPTLL